MCLVVGEGIRNALPQGGAPLVFGVRNKLSYYGAPPCMKPNMKPTNGQDSDRTRSTQFITLFQRVLWTARFASSKNACFFVLLHGAMLWFQSHMASGKYNWILSSLCFPGSEGNIFRHHLPSTMPLCGSKPNSSLHSVHPPTLRWIHHP